MPRKSTADRLYTLRQKREQLDAQLRALEARNKQAERKADTRRKVIAGALALEHYEKNPNSEFRRIIFRLLDEYVLRPHDRALFPELVEADADSAQPGAEPAPNSPRPAAKSIRHPPHRDNRMPFRRQRLQRRCAPARGSASPTLRSI